LLRATDLGYDTKSTNEIFSKSVNSKMSPFNLSMREARDSKEHPNTVAIVVALDLTGSMGSVPANLVRNGLPTLMSTIIDGGQKDATLLFLGVGDHECDRSPLQVGQFESSDELLDFWLTSTYLEGGGGGNAGESYLLAWYLASYHTSIDCFEKRKEKGFLFTIGDEPTLKSIPSHTLKALMGDGQYENFTAVQLLDKAREKYNVYHIHLLETSAGRRDGVVGGWKQLMGDNLIIAERHTEIPMLIANKVNEMVKVQSITPKKKEEGKKQDDEIVL
jgi:hypothetical protein